MDYLKNLNITWISQVHLFNCILLTIIIVKITAIKFKWYYHVIMVIKEKYNRIKTAHL